MPIYRKRNESSLVSALMKYLAVLECNGQIAFFNRQQAGAITFQRKDKWSKIRLGREGVSDLWCIPLIACGDCKSAPMIWIEAKLDGQTQSEEQLQFQAKVELCGHYYFVVHDCNELELNFKKIGVIK